MEHMQRPQRVGIQAMLHACGSPKHAPAYVAKHLMAWKILSAFEEQHSDVWLAIVRVVGRVGHVLETVRLSHEPEPLETQRW
jgi:hypothetical protein